LSKKLADVDDVESALSPIVPEDQLRSNQPDHDFPCRSGSTGQGQPVRQA
jgi:hypothetical protein